MNVNEETARNNIQPKAENDIFILTSLKWFTVRLGKQEWDTNLCMFQ